MDGTTVTIILLTPRFFQSNIVIMQSSGLNIFGPRPLHSHPGSMFDAEMHPVDPMNC